MTVIVPGSLSLSFGLSSYSSVETFLLANENVMLFPVIYNANTAATATVVENENIEKGKLQQVREMQLDGGFVLPESNALGHSFRDYEKESLRREIAEKGKEEYEKLDKAVMSIWECSSELWA
ncbi:hypothetical protein QQP08_025386 [Theobroma cacao]|nr:hypothetical protein QQP08_025386 [Theobroma cacao]